jgi:hypothetical protein
MAHFSAKLNFKCVLDVYRFALEEEEYVEFSKLTQDRIIGTKGEMATVSVIISIYELYSVYQMVYIYTTFDFETNLRYKTASHHGEGLKTKVI